MPTSLPHLDIVTSGGPAAEPGTPWYRARRTRLFLLVFGLALGVGQGLNLTRPAVYRSSATVLTVAPPKVDEQVSAARPDAQHVAIQRQLLLGQPLLRETLQHLETTGEAQRFGLTSAADLQRMLAVLPVSSTQLVELRAEGAARALLAPLVNAWIESYVAYRERAIQAEVGETLAALRAKYGELGERLETARAELAAFRERHEIVSQGRTENWAHARLQGLNHAINEAQDREARTRAELQALEEAIGAGEQVVPEAEKPGLLKLQFEAKTLRKKLAGYDKRFTRKYMQVDPAFRDLPEKLEAVEQEIRFRSEQGRQQVLADARHAALAATETVRELERQREAHKREAAEFTARFAEQAGMVKALEGLEALQRTTGERMAKIESESLEKYPQVKVVDWAYPPVDPVYPYYLRDALLVLAGALGLGLLAVWLRDYLERPASTAPEPAGLTGIRVYPPAPSLAAGERVVEALPQGQAAALAAPTPRELSTAEMEALWRGADDPGRRLLALLLSGLTLEEAEALPADAFDTASGELAVAGRGARRLPLGPGAAALFRVPGALPLQRDPAPADATAELEARLKLLAYDGGLPFPEQIDAASLRHSYLLYLVRQGARLRELERIAGPVPPRELAALAPFSPAGPGRPLAEVDTVHPLLHRDPAGA